MAFVIRQGVEGAPAEEVCRKAGISQQTYINWRRKYADLALPLSRYRKLSKNRPSLASVWIAA